MGTKNWARTITRLAASKQAANELITILSAAIPRRTC